MLPEIPMVEFTIDRIGLVCFHVPVGIAVHEFNTDEPVPSQARIKAQESIAVFDKVPKANGVLGDAVIFDTAFGVAACPVVRSEREMGLGITDAYACPDFEIRDFFIEVVGLGLFFETFFLGEAALGALVKKCGCNVVAEGDFVIVCLDDACGFGFLGCFVKNGDLDELSLRNEQKNDVVFEGLNFGGHAGVSCAQVT